MFFFSFQNRNKTIRPLRKGSGYSLMSNFLWLEWMSQISPGRIPAKFFFLFFSWQQVVPSYWRWYFLTLSSQCIDRILAFFFPPPRFMTAICSKLLAVLFFDIVIIPVCIHDKPKPFWVICPPWPVFTFQTVFVQNSAHCDRTLKLPPCLTPKQLTVTSFSASRHPLGLSLFFSRVHFSVSHDLLVTY